MRNKPVIALGKIVSYGVQKLNLGNGSTWPGHIALKYNKFFIRDILKTSKTKTIIVTGTNGKTTTSKLIATILKRQGKTVLHNDSGANLLNGIASSLLLHTSIQDGLQYDYAIFEVDENALPLVLQEITPTYLIILNLFRDQLDRYGELNSIAAKWARAIQNLAGKTMLILNADDPLVAYLGKNNDNRVIYFSCNDVLIHRNSQQLKDHAADSTYCPKCGNKLKFNSIIFSHLGNWECKTCGLKRPQINTIGSTIYPLSGLYNQYNIHAAILFARHEHITNSRITAALREFKPAFGRQEELTVKNKRIKIFLSKNPTGFNESLRTIKEMGAKTILFILNDRIPDGRDVSWIWDTDIENILEGNERIFVSGDRVYDMTLRIKYAGENTDYKGQIANCFENLKEAINASLDATENGNTLYILPTYTAMLEVRKILTGRKIL